MKIKITMSLLLLSTTIIAGCGGSDSDPVETFSATITDIQINRAADQLDMSVAVPSETSAVISVR